MPWGTRYGVRFQAMVRYKVRYRVIFQAIVPYKVPYGHWFQGLATWGNAQGTPLAGVTGFDMLEYTLRGMVPGYGTL